MSAENATAIVLRVVEFSETSCVVTLLTREFGRIGALAKGARRAKNPFDSALDLLTLCRVVFLRKTSGGLELLTEARLERRFRPPAKDVARLYAGYYVAELLLSLTDDYDPHPELFDLADATLLELGHTRLAASGIVLRFELLALRLLGHLPSLDNCVQCGKPIAPTGRVAFGQLAGGVLCDGCRVGKRQVVSVSGPALAAMKTFAAENDRRWEAAELGRVRGEVRGVVGHYLNNLLGRRPRMHPYLGFL
jgi:DNA repair protein RecO (recombination protein O)